MINRAIVRGTGHYLPDRVVPNSEFEASLDTSDDWIRARTGIERRHFAADGQTSSDLAVRAARAALDNAGLTPADIDAIILATSTAAMIEAPIRFYVTENADGTATLSYKLPSTVFAPYLDEGGADLAALAAELDRHFAAIAAQAAE